MSKFGKLPTIPVETENLITKGSRVVILHDGEPDDKVAISYIDQIFPATIPMLILTVSPNPAKHTREITDLLYHLGSCRKQEENREFTILTGAQYGNEIEGKFKEPEDQGYVTNLNDFIIGAPDNSVLVYMLTTCYSLMKHWKEEWGPKIRMVFNMGGEGVSKIDESTGKTVKTLGFNYRVGTEYIDAFMSKIPVEKRIILETNAYIPEFKHQFNGVVSICPRTFGNFSATLMKRYLEMNPFVKSLVDSNESWVDKFLQDWKEGEQYYPDKKLKHFYFGPADILLAVCSFDPRFYTLKLRELEVGDKKYMIRSMQDFDFESMDTCLAGFINDIVKPKGPEELEIDVSFKRPTHGHGGISDLLRFVVSNNQ